MPIPTPRFSPEPEPESGFVLSLPDVSDAVRVSAGIDGPHMLEKRRALFDRILAILTKESQTPEGQARIRSFGTRNGDTQKSERLSIAYVVSVLEGLGLSYTHASSQLPRDLQNVGGIGLDIEIKTSNGTTTCLNDTAPHAGVYYILFHTTNPKSRKPTRLPQVVGCKGSEMVDTDQVNWIAELQQKIEEMRTIYGKGDARKRKLTAFPRCNFQYNFEHLLTSLPTKKELETQLKALGLPIMGKKEDLEQRLALHKMAQSEGGAAAAAAAAPAN